MDCERCQRQEIDRFKSEGDYQEFLHKLNNDQWFYYVKEVDLTPVLYERYDDD